MKYLLYIFVYIFLTSTAYAFEFDCSKDVRDEAYSAMIGNKETNIPKSGEHTVKTRYYRSPI